MLRVKSPNEFHTLFFIMKKALRRIICHSYSEASASQAGGNLLLGLLTSTSANRPNKLKRLQRLFTSPALALLLLWAMVLAYTVLMLQQVFYRYEVMEFNFGWLGWDLAIFDQATWLISRGQTPFVTVRGLHILADHFSVILYLLAPFYWLWPSAKVLLVAQTLALASGALPVFALARERLESAWWGVLFAGVYLLYPTMQWANIYEMHPDTLAVPLLLGAFVCLRRGNWKPYALCLLGVAFTKENAGLTICALGVWVWWSVNRRAGWLTLIGGILAVVVALGTIRHFNNNTSSGYYLLYAKYGNSIPEVGLGVLRRPDMVWDDVTSDKGREYLGHMMRPMMYLPMLSPSVIVAAAPALLTNLLSGRTWMRELRSGYYSSLIIPLFLIASIESCRRLRGIVGRRGMAVVAANLAVWSVLDIPKSPLWKGGGEVPGVPLTQMHILQERRRSTEAIIKRIPSEASVTAQAPLLSYMSHRKQIYTFPNPFLERAWGNTLKARRELEQFGGYHGRPPHLQADVDAAKVEYVALLPRANNPFPMNQSNVEDYLLALLKSPSYGIIFMDRHGILFRRHAPHREGWRLLAKAAAKPVANEKQVEAALWTWMAQ